MEDKLLAGLLRRYARDYVFIDDLYKEAKKIGLAANRDKFAELLTNAFKDPYMYDSISTELPHTRTWVKAKTPDGKDIGYIKWIYGR